MSFSTSDAFICCFRSGVFVKAIHLFLFAFARSIFISEITRSFICSRWNTLNTNHWHSLVKLHLCSIQPKDIRFSFVLYSINDEDGGNDGINTDSGIIHTIIFFHRHFLPLSTLALLLLCHSVSFSHWKSIKFIAPNLPHINSCLQFFAMQKNQVAPQCSQMKPFRLTVKHCLYPTDELSLQIFVQRYQGVKF